MNNSLPKHSVLIITYNQENLIARALDSLLCQKEFLFEIVVCDDCSTDNNWEVIMEYQRQYPDLIRPYRNSKNLGIFGNLENSWTLPKGEIIWYLSGDDEYCNGVFEKANELIKTNDISYKIDSFTLYFDFMFVKPSGEFSVYRNNLILKHNALSLKIRDLIYNRTIGFSKSVLEKFTHIDKEIGIYTDGLIDIQVQLFSESNYYYPFVGSKYYVSIGISSVTKKSDSLISYIKLMSQYRETLRCLSNNDRKWLNFSETKAKYLLQPSLTNYFLYLKYFIYSRDIEFGGKRLSKELKHLLFYLFKLRFNAQTFFKNN